MSTVEAKLFSWIENMAAYFQDGETSLSKCLEKAQEKYNVPQELIKWFEETYYE